MLPIIWVAISPSPFNPIDHITLKELRLGFSSLSRHNEKLSLHVISRPNDFGLISKTVPEGASVRFHGINMSRVYSAFKKVGVTGGSHHSRIGGACKLFLPTLAADFGIGSSFIFVDTDVVFLRPASTLMTIYNDMLSHHLISATVIRGLGYTQRINSGVMIFKGVNPKLWQDAVLGALMLNPLNCDPFHWGPYHRPVCIRNKNGSHVGGDQEVFSVVVSATSCLYPLPNFVHRHLQGRFQSVPEDTAILHYKNYDDAYNLTKRLLFEL